MTSPITCLITLHGIGFEQPPLPGVSDSGYADPLHEHLSKYLGSILSDDPNRSRSHSGENGAIYVQSRWLSNAGVPCREEGLKRIGSWSQDRRQIIKENAPLVADGGRVSHIALVYSNLEPTAPEIGAALITSAMSLFSAWHYTHALGLLHMAMADILAIIGNRHTAPANDQQAISSRPRSDLAHRHARHSGTQQQAPSSSPSGLVGLLRPVEDDVACYICHNEERERVRSFVFEALLRLAARDDVGAIIFNTHSNGTVVGLDALRQLPPFASEKIKAFITAGSPLRKYVDLFQWGQQIESLNPIKPWYNFWDECDPVADPLEPPITWRRGDELISPCDPKLFSLLDPDSGTTSNIEVTDIKVDNVHKSTGGGLQAHNYWDNEEQFVKPLVDTIVAQATQQIVTAA